MALTKRTRYEVLRRDGFACKYCGAKAPDVELDVDHVLPVALGGSDDFDNLVAACKDCNQGKASTNPDDPLVADVSAFDAAFARAMSRATIEDTERMRLRDLMRESFDDIWLSWSAQGRQVPRDRRWPTSIDTFIKSGLALEDLEDLVGVAMRANVPAAGKWKYFCGCCWTRLKERRERAMELMVNEGWGS